MLTNEFKLFMSAQNMHQKSLYHTTLSAKKASASGRLRSPDPLPSFILQQNLIFPSHQIRTNEFSWIWAIQPFCWLIQIIASNIYQNEWFQVWLFKNFLGRGSPSPPQTPPPFFLGLHPRFGLRPQFSGASRPRLRLRPRFSGASRPRFGLRPQLSNGDLDLAPPQSKFLDPPVLSGHFLVCSWCFFLGSSIVVKVKCAVVNYYKNEELWEKRRRSSKHNSNVTGEVRNFESVKV